MRHSDVAFMYQAERGVYEAYGATVLAWGGKPTPQSLEAARGVKFFGSVGMVTEFARYYERFADTYEQGLCRDVHGEPVKVPWLTDHQHKGIPYWWCCTRQPLPRQYFKERVMETVRAGADGVHIDDHMGTAGGLWLGICFCDRCVDGFRVHLQALSSEARERLGVTDPAAFDYREVVRAWLAEDETRQRRVTGHPLWGEWTVYQCRGAASFMAELRDLAAQTAGKPVPMGANAGLLWPRHLVDYKTLDLFSAETDHHAAARHFSDLPLMAYRMADAVGRPYAATASGGDWAFVKEQNLPGLVRGWIALSYAGGQNFMAPHRQWCYTAEKGTHWYEGPVEKFAPLYQFVRRHAALFDGYENAADVGLVIPHGDYAVTPGSWFHLGNQLAAANLAYRILLAGDDLVDLPLAADDWRACPALLVPNTEDFLPRDRALVEGMSGARPVYRSLEEALKGLRPAVRVEGSGTVRCLPRVKKGAAVVHLLNYQYDSDRDDVVPIKEVQVRVDLKALGVPEAASCRYHVPDAEPVTLPVRDGLVEVPSLPLWGILAF